MRLMQEFMPQVMAPRVSVSLLIYIVAASKLRSKFSVASLYVDRGCLSGHGVGQNN
jgi:hypothetical protein